MGLVCDTYLTYTNIYNDVERGRLGAFGAH